MMNFHFDLDPYRPPGFQHTQLFRFPEMLPKSLPTKPVELADPSLTPLPMHPGIEYVAASLGRNFTLAIVCMLIWKLWSSTALRTQRAEQLFLDVFASTR